jgi:hypothetical protein
MIFEISSLRPGFGEAPACLKALLQAQGAMQEALASGRATGL